MNKKPTWLEKTTLRKRHAAAKAKYTVNKQYKRYVDFYLYRNILVSMIVCIVQDYFTYSSTGLDIINRIDVLKFITTPTSMLILSILSIYYNIYHDKTIEPIDHVMEQYAQDLFTSIQFTVNDVIDNNVSYAWQRKGTNNNEVRFYQVDNYSINTGEIIERLRKNNKLVFATTSEYQLDSAISVLLVCMRDTFRSVKFNGKIYLDDIDITNIINDIGTKKLTW